MYSLRTIRPMETKISVKLEYTYTMFLQNSTVFSLWITEIRQKDRFKSNIYPFINPDNLKFLICSQLRECFDIIKFNFLQSL